MTADFKNCLIVKKESYEMGRSKKRIRELFKT